ncbi:hypothetical protein [Agarivorans gilvus]|uniref:Plasmodium RESA N-terminal domain-containing protein n=1 Tax=Agarivorans gilvus TaxID=680279 RepID=A0ABQ1HZC8_9ALTE|nr:hypothetical protein [Agarivorans gilvus]GGA95638.1 hypothetical protein GCM10007414_05600 [Agarivorans gilvus]
MGSPVVKVNSFIITLVATLFYLPFFSNGGEIEKESCEDKVSLYNKVIFENLSDDISFYDSMYDASRISHINRDEFFLSNTLEELKIYEELTDELELTSLVAIYSIIIAKGSKDQEEARVNLWKLLLHVDNDIFNTRTPNMNLSFIEIAAVLKRKRFFDLQKGNESLEEHVNTLNCYLNYN